MRVTCYFYRLLDANLISIGLQTIYIAVISYRTVWIEINHKYHHIIPQTTDWILQSSSNKKIIYIAVIMFISLRS